jgi:hypothetical protein
VGDEPAQSSDDCTRVWELVESLTADLAPAARHAVRAAVTEQIHSGAQPSALDIATLIARTAGQLSTETMPRPRRRLPYAVGQLARLMGKANRRNY